MKHVTIYTDGSCKGNPGPGGYGAILQYVDDQACHFGKLSAGSEQGLSRALSRDRRSRRHEKAISGGIPHTTNNRAELLAAIQALRALKEPCRVELYTDSQYLVTVATGGQARANLDLVSELRALMQTHQVAVHRIAGHNGHPGNERADRLAQEAAALQAQVNPIIAERGQLR